MESKRISTEVYTWDKENKMRYLKHTYEFWTRFENAYYAGLPEAQNLKHAEVITIYFHPPAKNSVNIALRFYDKDRYFYERVGTLEDKLLHEFIGSIADPDPQKLYRIYGRMFLQTKEPEGPCG